VLADETRLSSRKRLNCTRRRRNPVRIHLIRGGREVTWLMLMRCLRDRRRYERVRRLF
jgi:hypothetical protein